MDQAKAPQLDAGLTTSKKRRSQTTRRPKADGQSLPDPSSMLSTPVSDEMNRVSGDENIDGHSGGKMFNLSQCVSRSLPSDSSPMTGASDGAGTENKLKRVKLKVGGMTRTVHTKSSFNGSSSSGSNVNGNQVSENAQPRQKGNSDEHHSARMDKKSGLQGIPWKDFSASFGIRREDVGKTPARSAVDEKGDKLDAVRKSRRVQKRRMDEDFDEEDDDEIRYLEKLKTSRMSGYKDWEAQPVLKQQKGGKPDTFEDPARVSRDAKKSKSGDMDYKEEEGSYSDNERDGVKKKKQKKGLSELPTESKKEIALTTRQRALLSKDSSAAGTSQVEFPNSLPLAPPRKQKEKLSEVEKQLKKAEAAQRRKLQNEKAARETEEEAIRKILGQDSSRKKREEKIKKRQEELAQEKMANALLLASNTIRTIMGPNGTTVSFPEELGFPKIFEPLEQRYPPPRETCAGPSCSNPYKYRDSKSRLPLCSLQCYKAVHESMASEKAY